MTKQNIQKDFLNSAEIFQKLVKVLFLPKYAVFENEVLLILFETFRIGVNVKRQH